MNRTRFVAQAGVIAAGYAALTLVTLLVFDEFAWGPIQFRVSEAFTVVAVFTPAAIPGLWLGAMVANAFMITRVGALALWDVALGSLGSLLGAAWTWRLRDRPALALLGPVIANALIVPTYLPVLMRAFGIFDVFYRLPGLGVDASQSMLATYLFGVVTVGVGEAAVVYALGLPLLNMLRRAGVMGILHPEGSEGRRT